MPLRPTPDALRERVFAILGERIHGARLLDLFAGTGSVGLEALSRGAASVVFVERHRAAAQLLRQNIDSFELTREQARCLVRPALDAVRDLARRGESFDLAWADPPFEVWEGGLDVLAQVFALHLLQPEGLICLECPERANVEEFLAQGLRIDRDLKGGASRVVMVARRD